MSANAGLTPYFQFAQVHACPGIDQLARCQLLQQSWKILHDKSGPGLSPGQHAPRDSWGRSPEISSNPDRRNLSPGPRIVSWTESPSTSCPVTCRPQRNNKSGEVAAARRDVTLIYFSRARDHGSQIVLRGNSSLIFRLWRHQFSKCSRFAAIANWSILEGNLFAGGERCLTVVPKGSDTYRSAGVCTCCQRIVLVALTRSECKRIRDRFALPLSGHRAIHGLGSVTSVERMQHNMPSLDFQIPRMHQDTLDGCFLPAAWWPP